MKPKLNHEEVTAIRHNLVALGLLTYAVNFDKNTLELKVNNSGLNTYTTLLYLLQKRQILNGPPYSDEQIKHNHYSFIEKILLEQKFIEIIGLKYILTKRGMEHVYVMFISNEPIYSKINKLIGLGKV